MSSENRLSLSLLKEFDAAALQQALSGAAASSGAPQQPQQLAPLATPRSGSGPGPSPGTYDGANTTRSSRQPAVKSPAASGASKKKKKAGALALGGGDGNVSSDKSKVKRHTSPLLRKPSAEVLLNSSSVLTLNAKTAAVISDRVLPPPPEARREKFVQFTMAPLPEMSLEPPPKSAAPVRSCFKGSYLAELLAAQDALSADFPEAASELGDDKKNAAKANEPPPKVGLDRLCDVSAREAKIKELKNAIRKKELAECRFKPKVDKRSLEIVAAKQLKKNGGLDSENFHSDPLLNVPIVAEEPSPQRLHITPRARKMRRSVDDLLAWGKELNEAMADARIVVEEEPPKYRAAITPRSRRIAEGIADRRSTVVEHAQMLAAANAKQASKRRDARAAEKELDIGLQAALVHKQHDSDDKPDPSRRGSNNNRSSTPDPSSKTSSKMPVAKKLQGAADEVQSVDLEWWLGELKKDTAFACNQLKDALHQRRSLTFV